VPRVKSFLMVKPFVSAFLRATVLGGFSLARTPSLAEAIATEQCQSRCRRNCIERGHAIGLLGAFSR